jgi:6-pyruvoyl-tetrahydropterin synthase
VCTLKKARGRVRLSRFLESRALIMEAKKIALKVFHSFKASHSLAGFETPHFHLWKIAVKFQAAFPIKGDRLIDMIAVQSELIQITAPLEGTYLNDSLGASPTSENMATFVWKKVAGKFPGQSLHSVSITLCTLDGEATGEAILS